MNRATYKVPADRRDALLQLYLHGGQKAVERLCIELNVSPKYAANLAAAMGLHRHKYKSSEASTRSANDARWSRAIQVGKVVA